MKGVYYWRFLGDNGTSQAVVYAIGHSKFQSGMLRV